MTGMENKAPESGAGVAISWFSVPDESEKSIRGPRYNSSAGKAWIREKP